MELNGSATGSEDHVQLPGRAPVSKLQSLLSPPNVLQSFREVFTPIWIRLGIVTNKKVLPKMHGTLVLGRYKSRQS